MASSNRHWPSMFKSKPSNSSHHQSQHHDINSSHISSGFHRSPYAPVSACEERTPEPKPRWNPKPEQIRILEAIFNSGMVNPPRDEIRKIRAQLQEYGQVGDANVFYWFQNRKSRSKHKQRQLQNNKLSQLPPTTTPPPITATAPAASSSSSSDKSSPNNSKEKALSVSSSTVIDLLNSPSASVNQPFFQPPTEFVTEAFFFPMQQSSAGSSSTGAGLTQGLCFPDIIADQSVGNCPSSLLGELMLMNHDRSKKVEDDDQKMKLHELELSYAVTPAPNAADPIVHPSLSVPLPTNQINLQGEGLGEQRPQKSTVFINDVCFEVAVGPFNVKEAFGDDAVLVHSSGQPVLTNEWGVTLQPLQHGAFYYLIRAFSPSPSDRTIDLI
ncbi:hypothetical protein CDL12_11736 [Handroanthus impetiginosus]|uniref:Protein WUSCHEL n=1 Tax=Handroanthus impetiginosus TaxID=429701 RepID=A0A2G9HDL7_9LAMI|nr:hypothetical protein CDL12_11736 [Handroanthus impetiginosus]